MFLVAFFLALRERTGRRQPPAERSPCNYYHHQQHVINCYEYIGSRRHWRYLLVQQQYLSLQGVSPSITEAMIPLHRSQQHRLHFQTTQKLTSLLCQARSVNRTIAASTCSILPGKISKMLGPFQAPIFAHGVTTSSPIVIQHSGQLDDNIPQLSPSTWLQESPARSVPATWLASYKPKRAKSSISIAAAIVKTTKRRELQYGLYHSSIGTGDTLVGPHLLEFQSTRPTTASIWGCTP